MTPPLLEVRDLVLRRDDGTGSAILNDVNITVNDGDVLIIQGESGCGKTTLLKCIAELNVFQKGQILLHGKPSTDYGIPLFRTRVQYVPQRPSLLPGTPMEFLGTARSFAARKQRDAEVEELGVKLYDPIELAQSWGIEKRLWNREWGTLSGGEGQRISLAIAIGLGGAEVLLLDEPTSALDFETTKLVEKSLLGMLPGDGNKKGTLKAFMWITHASEQADRVGTRDINLTHPQSST